jgi:hypothetical protein
MMGAVFAAMLWYGALALGEFLRGPGPEQPPEP